jgi:hypothetical protein
LRVPARRPIRTRTTALKPRARALQLVAARQPQARVKAQQLARPLPGARAQQLAAARVQRERTAKPRLAELQQAALQQAVPQRAAAAHPQAKTPATMMSMPL